MSTTESFHKRAAAWCAADDPKLSCGTGPLARYVYMLRLLAQGAARLARLLLKRRRSKQ
jgi:hypothetical protein